MHPTEATEALQCAPLQHTLLHHRDCFPLLCGLVPCWAHTLSAAAHSVSSYLINLLLKQMNGRCSLGPFDWQKKGGERLVEHTPASTLMLPAPVDDIR